MTTNSLGGWTDIILDKDAALRASTIDLGGPEPTQTPTAPMASTPDGAGIRPASAPVAAPSSTTQARLAALLADAKAGKLAHLANAHVAPDVGPIRQDVKDRADDADARLLAAGFSIEPRLYVNGQTMMDIGYEKASQERRDFDGMPAVAELCDDIIDKVASEKRQDIEVDLGSVRFLKDEKKAFRVEVNGLPSDLKHERQGLLGLAGRLTTHRGGSDGSRYLADLDVERRVRNLNEHVADILSDGGKQAVLRTRQDRNGDRTVFACVGPQYDRAIDADVIAGIVREALDGLGLRGEAAYDGRRLLVKGFVHTPIAIEEHGVGEPFQAGTRIQTADDGSSALYVESMVLRRRCLNASTSADKLTTKIVHRTSESREQRVSTVRAAIQKSLDINPFIEAWSRAAKDNVLDSGADPIEKIRILVERGFVKNPKGSTKETTIDRIRKCWEMERGYTRTALVNAITAAAHRFPWQSPWAQAQLEEDAGKLVYVRNLNLN